MTMWKPALDPDKPRYRALADAIEADLSEGRLKTGDRLPPHRDLADALGVTVGTVTRGYAEARRRGLTTGEVGRGTFLRAPESEDPWAQVGLEAELTDLTFILPVTLPDEGRYLAKTLKELSESPSLHHLVQYQDESSLRHQRIAGSQWLQQLGLQVPPDQLLITAGSQHGLNVALSSLFHVGQTLLCGELTYPSIKGQARAYGLNLRGVTLDDQGICPQALDRACQGDNKPAGLYLVPTLQNPTSAIMSQERRQEIARIAQRHQLLIIEDDVHAFSLEETHAPIITYAPDHTVYLTSLAKCLNPGLRTGYIVAPTNLQARLLTGIHTSMWMGPPLMVEVATRWIQDGTAQHIIQAKRAETQRRQALVTKYLGQYDIKRNASCAQVWLELPEPWSTDEFVTEARENGIKLVGASSFAISRRNAPHAVRFTIGQPSITDLERALAKLAEILSRFIRATC